MNFSMKNGWWFVLGLLTIIFFRIMPIVSRDFPINDGGMIYVMTKELADNGFRIPFTSTYNLSGIPYTYPPLAFLTGGMIHVFFKTDYLEIFKWLPTALACLVLVPFYWLARLILGKKDKARMALVMYTVLPSAYYTLIAGGGIPRGMGLIFSLLTLVAWIAGWSKRKKIYDFFAAIFLAGAILSHLEMAMFTVVGMLLSTWYYKMSRTRLLKTGVWAGLLTSWWWILIIFNWGISPFIAAAHSNIVNWGSEAGLWTLGFTREQTTTIFSVLGAMGILLLIAKGKWLVPLWFLAIFQILWRGPETTASVLFAIAGGEMIVTFIQKIATPNIWQRRVVWGLLGFWILAYFFTNNVNSIFYQNEWMDSLSRQDRKAMAWVTNYTPPEGRWLVYAGGTPGLWASDEVAEWFPALTGRQSVFTLQGTEWLKGKTMATFDNLALINKCFSQTDCLDRLPKIFPREKFDFVYLTNQESCFVYGCNWDYGDKNFSLTAKTATRVYKDEGVEIWKMVNEDVSPKGI